ncbi:MAG: hypothetical protein RBT80_10825 [Candidatus Vecturithrix sp.]|jgi:hypothetical protein|nr:hypothetical protein [Candidatus Vecturithrix sp.]
MKTMIQKHVTLIAPSTSIITGVNLIFPGDILELRFDYEKDGMIYRSGIQFTKVRAHHHVAEIYCPAWKIECSYDTVVEILDSPWADELKKLASENQRDAWVLHHYMIYFDSDGCFEVIAAAWDILPEEKGPWE